MNQSQQIKFKDNPYQYTRGIRFRAVPCSKFQSKSFFKNS